MNTENQLFSSGVGVNKLTKVTIPYNNVGIALPGLVATLTIYTLQAKEYINDIKIIPTTAYSGGSVSACTASIGVSTGLTKYTAAVNIFTGNTLITDTHILIPGLESTSASIPLLLTITSTVGLLNTLSAGSLDIYIFTTILL